MRGYWTVTLVGSEHHQRLNDFEFISRIVSSYEQSMLQATE
ncbi:MULTISPECIES: hypothetical protein [Rhizobium]|uniref:Uncharacterized protein n=1 Tax=Rhizobium favelukesii TaxID=348824 RepID=W6RJE1_9HYPH|nr:MULTISPECIES: hypothetical protein [Rhizobium]CDM60964.1 hypothetical protein LPU83_pLPU83c_0402 [Rhizobium favelukesii]